MHERMITYLSLTAVSWLIAKSMQCKKKKRLQIFATMKNIFYHKKIESPSVKEECKKRSLLLIPSLQLL